MFAKISNYWKAVGSVLGSLAIVLPTLAGVIPEKYGAILTGIAALIGTYFSPANKPSED